jgi:predicted DNA-binding protein
MPVVSVRVDKSVYEGLAKLASERGVSLYEYVKSILEAHVSGQVSYEHTSKLLEEVATLKKMVEELVQKKATGEGGVAQTVRLQTLASKLGYESPDKLLEHLLDWWEPLLTQSKITVKDTWIYVEIGDSRVAFNITQVDKMCKLRILPEHLCREVRARIPWL